MGNKVYAVRVGREVGLFYTWEECSASVTRFKGAVYRGFKCKKSADRYLGIAPPRVHPPWLIQFDGGSSLEDSVAGAGWVIYRGGEEVASGSVALPPGNTNNEAEYAAAILALEEAVEMMSACQAWPCNKGVAVPKEGGQLHSNNTALPAWSTIKSRPMYSKCSGLRCLLKNLCVDTSVSRHT